MSFNRALLLGTIRKNLAFIYRVTSISLGTFNVDNTVVVPIFSSRLDCCSVWVTPWPSHAQHPMPRTRDTAAKKPCATWSGCRKTWRTCDRCWRMRRTRCSGIARRRWGSLASGKYSVVLLQRGQFSPKSSQKISHSSPVRPRYGVSVVILKSDSLSAAVITVPSVR